MFKKLKNHFWGAFFLITSILLIVSLIFANKFNLVPVFLVICLIMSIMLHLGCAYESKWSDPTKIKIVSVKILKKRQCIWETRYFVFEQHTVTDYYMGYFIKSKTIWPENINYRERYNDSYETKEDAMIEILLTLKTLKANLYNEPTVKDIEEVYEITVAEELTKIEI